MSFLPLTTLPKWIKIPVTFSTFSIAGLTQNVTIYSLPAKAVIHSVFINTTTPFSGGLIASYTMSVGIAGTLAKYAVATNVFTGATLPVPALVSGVESMSAATDIKAAVISTVGNLDTATAGAADIYLLVSNLE